MGNQLAEGFLKFPCLQTLPLGFVFKAANEEATRISCKKVSFFVEIFGTY